MTIIDLHCEFAECLGQLLVYATEKGYRIRLGPHNSGLGVDLLAYVEGKLTHNRLTYEFLARKWRQLSPCARWGGDEPLVTFTYFYFTIPPGLRDD